MKVARMAAALILIVEDFADSREMYVEFLQAQGFRVSAAEDGIAALRSIESAIPDLVVLDVALPCLPEELLAAVQKALDERG